MSKKWLSYVNFLFLSSFIILSVFALGLVWNRNSEIPLPVNEHKRTELPKRTFAFSKESYETFATSALQLKFSPPSMLLPDLRHHLNYYGTNGRPDASKDRSLLHFSFANNKIPGSAEPGEKVYLLYDKSQVPGKYVFSPNNAETSLWMEVNPKGQEAFVKVNMKNEHGQVVQEPYAYAEFTLPEKEFGRVTGNWEIGKWRVDGSLLARQKARWYGPDIFLEKHGGEEFGKVIGKQRIDFAEDEEGYSCFIAQGESLIWENDRWKEIGLEDDSRGKPLLHLKKIDDRLMVFEVWDPEGKSKIVVNMIKSAEPWTPQNIVKEFKFVGARTRTQCVFEINQDRMLLRPNDWLLLTDSGWKKLATVQEIDDYVERKTTGALFVFNGLEKKEDKQVLVGTMYNAARTEMHTVELAVQQSNVSVTPKSEIENIKPDLEQATIYLPKVFPKG